MNFLKYKRHDVGEVGLLVTLVLGLIFVVGFPPKDMYKHMYIYTQTPANERRT